MHLSDFILGHMESLLADWEQFAATGCPAGAHMAPLALRDHAEPMLRAIAADIARPQSRQAQSDKSKGLASPAPDLPNTAAQTHALLRAQSGFDIVQLVSEYRALRASVLRQWLDHLGDAQADPDEVIRFNEAIDQAVAESVAAFSNSAEQARNLLLGMLGHDMRSPLQTIQMTAGYLSTLGGDGHGEWDAMRLRQSLANLVVNALRHGDADGTVRVHLDGAADHVRLEVENQGPVLDPVQLLQLFEPLARASRPEWREDSHSLGLGLHICREVARAHGGDIVASSDAAATRFTLRLPRQAPAAG